MDEIKKSMGVVDEIKPKKKGMVVPTMFGPVDKQQLDDKLWADYKFVKILVSGTIGAHKEKDEKLKVQVKKIRDFLSAEEGIAVTVVTVTEEEEAAQVNGASKVIESQGAL